MYPQSQRILCLSNHAACVGDITRRFMRSVQMGDLQFFPVLKVPRPEVFPTETTVTHRPTNAMLAPGRHLCPRCGHIVQVIPCGPCTGFLTLSCILFSCSLTPKSIGHLPACCGPSVMLCVSAMLSQTFAYCL